MSKQRIFKAIVSLAASIALVAATSVPAPAADERPTFIRDAEIESTIRSFATPLFQAAGLSPEAIEVHLISNEKINAFVAGGQNLFLYTGLLIRSESANQVVGVIAHETGHIAGGHLARLQNEVEKAELEMLAAVILGLGAAAASGQAGAATAVMGAGGTLVQRN